MTVEACATCVFPSRKCHQSDHDLDASQGAIRSTSTYTGNLVLSSIFVRIQKMEFITFEAIVRQQDPLYVAMGIFRILETSIFVVKEKCRRREEKLGTLRTEYEMNATTMIRRRVLKNSEIRSQELLFCKFVVVQRYQRVETSS